MPRPLTIPAYLAPLLSSLNRVRHPTCNDTDLGVDKTVARIATSYKNRKYRVSVRGPLSFRDLARLERACGAALEEHEPPLEVHLKAVSSIDEASRMFLRQLTKRGVLITNDTGA